MGGKGLLGVRWWYAGNVSLVGFEDAISSATLGSVGWMVAAECSCSGCPRRDQSLSIMSMRNPRRRRWRYEERRRRGSTREEYSFTGWRRVYIPASGALHFAARARRNRLVDGGANRWSSFGGAKWTCSARGKTLQARNGMHGRMTAGRPPKCASRGRCEGRRWAPELVC